MVEAYLEYGDNRERNARAASAFEVGHGSALVYIGMFTCFVAITCLVVASGGLILHQRRRSYSPASTRSMYIFAHSTHFIFVLLLVNVRLRRPLTNEAVTSKKWQTMI